MQREPMPHIGGERIDVTLFLSIPHLMGTAAEYTRGGKKDHSRWLHVDASTGLMFADRVSIGYTGETWSAKTKHPTSVSHQR